MIDYVRTIEPTLYTASSHTRIFTASNAGTSETTYASIDATFASRTSSAADSLGASQGASSTSQNYTGSTTYSSSSGSGRSNPSATISTHSASGSTTSSGLGRVIGGASATTSTTYAYSDNTYGTATLARWVITGSTAEVAGIIVPTTVNVTVPTTYWSAINGPATRTRIVQSDISFLVTRAVALETVYIAESHESVNEWIFYQRPDASFLATGGSRINELLLSFDSSLVLPPITGSTFSSTRPTAVATGSFSIAYTNTTTSIYSTTASYLENSSQVISHAQIGKVPMDTYTEQVEFKIPSTRDASFISYDETTGTVNVWASQTYESFSYVTTDSTERLTWDGSDGPVFLLNSTTVWTTAPTTVTIGRTDVSTLQDNEIGGISITSYSTIGIILTGEDRAQVDDLAPAVPIQALGFQIQSTIDPTAAVYTRLNAIGGSFIYEAELFEQAFAGNDHNPRRVSVPFNITNSTTVWYPVTTFDDGEGGYYTDYNYDGPTTLADYSWSDASLTIRTTDSSTNGSNSYVFQGSGLASTMRARVDLVQELAFPAFSIGYQTIHGGIPNLSNRSHTIFLSGPMSISDAYGGSHTTRYENWTSIEITNLFVARCIFLSRVFTATGAFDTVFAIYEKHLRDQ